MANSMTLIKQQIFSTNKINSVCVTTCCQIIIVPLQASSLFNWGYNFGHLIGSQHNHIGEYQLSQMVQGD